MLNDNEDWKCLAPLGMESTYTNVLYALTVTHLCDLSTLPYGNSEITKNPTKSKT